MAEGTVLAAGAPADVLADRRVVDAYLGVACECRPSSPLEIEGLAPASAGARSSTACRSSVPAGTVTAMLGLNGAGKSVAAQDGSRGSCRRGRAPSASTAPTSPAWTPEDRVRAGVGYVLQARALFPQLTVEQNLRLGGATLPVAGGGRAAAQVYERYPHLSERRRQPAGSLSGGEQAMLAMGRALMTGPAVLLVDEPTAGLAPTMVGHLVEQLAGGPGRRCHDPPRRAERPRRPRVADQVCVLQKGAVAYGPLADLDRDELARLLGIGDLVGSIRT